MSVVYGKTAVSNPGTIVNFTGGTSSTCSIDTRDSIDAIASLESRVSIEHVFEVPPVKMETVPGFETAVFPYTTDIPFLDAWGQPLLFGPGSIHVAHTADEYLSIAELHAAVDSYVRIAKGLLKM